MPRLLFREVCYLLPQSDDLNPSVINLPLSLQLHNGGCADLV